MSQKPPIPPEGQSESAAPPMTPESIDDAIRKLQSLADIQLKLRKERDSIESLDLLQKMLDGELLSEDELNTVKASLKGLSKYASLHTSYKTCLEEAQQARNLIDEVIGSSFITKSANTAAAPKPGATQPTPGTAETKDSAVESKNGAAEKSKSKLQLVES